MIRNQKRAHRIARRSIGVKKKSPQPWVGTGEGMTLFFYIFKK